VHNTLVGVGKRDLVKIGVSGKIISAFDVARAMALGANWCNSARGFMFALGCIQSRACHTDHCPTGVATQDPDRQRALVVPDKATRVKNFHDLTVEAFAELMGAAGLEHPEQITPHYVMVRDADGRAVSLASQIPTLEHGVLLDEAQLSNLPEPFRSDWQVSSPESFARAVQATVPA